MSENVMKWNFREELRKLSKEQLVEYTYEVVAKSLWTLQSNYMMNLQKKYGDSVAEEFEIAAFGKFCEVQCYRIRKVFNLGDDMRAFVKLNNYSQMFPPNAEMEWSEISEKRARLRITYCPMQVNRRDVLGIHEYPCKKGDLAIVQKIASVFNPKLRTTCVYAPPDEHPKDAWCEWIYEIGD